MRYEISVLWMRRSLVSSTYLELQEVEKYIIYTGHFDIKYSYIGKGNYSNDYSSVAQDGSEREEG